jgi:uncharacterized membrane protein YfcA
MLRILEIAWMVIAMTTGLVAGYLMLIKQFSESIFMIICTTIALVMYTVRRRQRIRYDLHTRKQEDDSRYH